MKRMELILFIRKDSKTSQMFAISMFITVSNKFPKGNQHWIFIGRTDAEAEAPTLWPADAKSQFTGKDPNAQKDCGQEVKGTTEA